MNKNFDAILVHPCNTKWKSDWAEGETNSKKESQTGESQISHYYRVIKGWTIVLFGLLSLFLFCLVLEKKIKNWQLAPLTVGEVQDTQVNSRPKMFLQRIWTTLIDQTIYSLHKANCIHPKHARIQKKL